MLLEMHTFDKYRAGGIGGDEGSGGGLGWSREFKQEESKKHPLQQQASPSVVRHLAFATKAGRNSSGEKTNQDNYIVHERMNGFEDRAIFGVCDGHGTFGHNVSVFIKKSLPSKRQVASYLSLQPLWCGVGLIE